MQETFCTSKNVTYINEYCRGHVVHSLTDSSHSRGTCILFSKKLNVTIEETFDTSDGRCNLVNVKIMNEDYTFVSVYAPNIEKIRNEYNQKLSKFIMEHTISFENLFICGDFNCCLLDSDRNKISHMKEGNFESYIKEFTTKRLL